MDSENRIGRAVFIRYVGGVKGEEPADDYSTGEPLKVLLGDRRLPRGIEDAILDMEVGEQRDVEVPCEKGYGHYQENLASWHPRSLVDDGYGLKVGDVIFWTNPDDGRSMPVWVTDATKDTVRLDFNHPFADKTLVYHIELIDLV